MLLDLSYEYLKYGTTVGRTGQLTKIVNNKDLTKSKYYDYDALGRLKTAYSFTNGNNPMTTNQWTQGYSYDRFGNRTGVTKTGTISYTDGLASLSFTDGAGKVRTNRITTAGYTYDEAGNLTRGQTEGASPGTSIWQRYQYDAAGRLACTKDDSSVLIADYSYGASNHRLKQTEYGSGGTTCYYAWDGNSIIAEFSDTGSALSWTKSYVFLGGRLLATPTPGGTNYHHPDRLGTRLVTTETGGLVGAEQTTLPYGTALDIESMNTPTNRRFTSYDRSQKTKLDYAVNRFYNACQGRFTQVDPIGMGAASLSDPQSLNLYAYVGSDPVNRTDPDGLFWKKLFGWIGKISKWITIALTVAITVLLIIQAPWAGTALGKIAVFFMKHKWVGALIGGGNTLGFITPGINGSSGGGLSGFVQQQNGGRPQSRPQLTILYTGGDTEFEKKKDDVISNIDSIVGSKECNAAFKKAGLKTPKEIYDGGLILGAKRALSDSSYNSALGITESQRSNFFRRRGAATTILNSKTGKVVILFQADAFSGKLYSLREVVTHEFIHAAGVGDHSGWFGGHDLSKYEHYDSIIKACK